MPCYDPATAATNTVGKYQHYFCKNIACTSYIDASGVASNTDINKLLSGQ